MTEVENAEEPAPKRGRRAQIVVEEGAVPRFALNWSGDGRRRWDALKMWREAVLETAGNSGRLVSIAWVLATAFDRGTGFCVVTDAKLATWSHVHISHVPGALGRLEDAKLIVRATVMVDGRGSRRIWPRLPRIPANSAGADRPADLAENPPAKSAGHTSKYTPYRPVKRRSAGG